MPNGHGYSFPYGVPLVLYPILAIGIAAGHGKWWGVGLIILAAVLAVLFAREGLSRRSFEEIQAKDPSMSRLTWRFNWLLFFALPPAVLALFGVVVTLFR